MKARYKRNNDKKSYSWMIVLGLLAGIATRLTDFFPNDTLWSFSSIATLFGFWMTTATLVIYFSSSNKNAAINVFLYLFSMTISFYLLKYILGFYIPKLSDTGFKWNLFFAYSIASAVCGAVGYILYSWNKGNAISSILYALPIGGLAAETIGVGVYFYNSHTMLFQLVFDAASLVILGCWFLKKSRSKLLFLIVVTAVAVVGYYQYYRLYI